MVLITNENRMTFLTESAGRLNHSRCQKVYLQMGGGRDKRGRRKEEVWTQLPRWCEIVEQWDRSWEGRKERNSGRLTLKRVRYYGEMSRFAKFVERS